MLLSILSPVFSDEQKGKCFDVKGLCDKYNPCCNKEGFCGKTFEYCGSTCIESGNAKGKKCLPLPACKSMQSSFSKDKIIKLSDYKGEYTKYDFTIVGDYEVQGNEVVLKMSKANSGSTLQSTRFVNYGRISADIKTSRGGGVVSAFITMSKGKDEIDIEWTGHKLEEVQTNWFHKGVIPPQDQTHFEGKKIKNSFEGFHNYAIDFNADRVQWYVDGAMIREFKRSGDEYPSEPAQFSFGIWDGGSGAEGTRDWAGGYIDWESEDMKKDGYYSVRVRNFKVECYGEPLSKDDDFEVDKDLGLVAKGDKEKSKTSKDMQGGGELGDENMFDNTKDPSKEEGSNTKVIDSRRQAPSSARSLSYSLLPLGLAALLNYN
ncbi:concanavalin A-like lectin/glucanase [Neoconidiobolus thromboides FSU 785]|nr:concanavalin A-like lectin/glucanase [Neoconidiobolus thromboides FSU 785]